MRQAKQFLSTGIAHQLSTPKEVLFACFHHERTQKPRYIGAKDGTNGEIVFDKNLCKQKALSPDSFRTGKEECLIKFDVFRNKTRRCRSHAELPIELVGLLVGHVISGGKHGQERAGQAKVIDGFQR